MKKAIVVTTIAPPNDCLRNLAKGAESNGYEFICIGDQKSPDEFHLQGCRYFGVRDQQSMNFNLASILPWNHYSRKNLGYLIAIKMGSECILETDDDNYPETEGFWNADVSHNLQNQISGSGWLNIYSYFGVDAWPRGFPLEKINESVVFKEETYHGTGYIKQSLVNGDPDVDAVFRLTRGLNIRFEDFAPVALAANIWCPFNSQNTLWRQQAYPLLYLPATCSFRATDIIRSYVAQRCLWEAGGQVVFSGSNARQIRNAHNLLQDFDDEIVIYLKSNLIKNKLSDLELETGFDTDIILKNLFRCYQCLVDLNVVAELELAILNAWSEDVSSLLQI